MLSLVPILSRRIDLKDISCRCKLFKSRNICRTVGVIFLPLEEEDEDEDEENSLSIVTRK